MEIGPELVEIYILKVLSLDVNIILQRLHVDFSQNLCYKLNVVSLTIIAGLVSANISSYRTWKSVQYWWRNSWFFVAVECL